MLADLSVIPVWNCQIPYVCNPLYECCVCVGSTSAYRLTARIETLLTPNFLVAPCALSEMN